jgi:hypothetical protein
MQDLHKKITMAQIMHPERSLFLSKHVEMSGFGHFLGLVPILQSLLVEMPTPTGVPTDDNTTSHQVNT